MRDFSDSTMDVCHSVVRASALSEFVTGRYEVEGPVRCLLLHRGFNDSFEVEGAGGERYVLRVSGIRARGAPDVASEVDFLLHLGRIGVPVARPVPTRAGSYVEEIAAPEGSRPTVLFRHLAGRIPLGRRDALAQGITLARVHDASEIYDGRDACRFRLDLDHLLHRQLAAVLALPAAEGAIGQRLGEIATRLSEAVTGLGALTWTRCHGDCHGGNARIIDRGIDAGLAAFFDFDDGGPGYLAYDLAVHLWATTFLGTANHDLWHAFVEGYRSVRPITQVDLEAVHLFVPIRQIWLMGEYAGRVDQMGTASLSPSWIERQLRNLDAWERAKLADGLFMPKRV